MQHTALAFAAALLVFALAACGDDAAPSADAAVDDDASADTDADPGLCPGQIAFEAAIVDYGTGEPPSVAIEVRQLGNENVTEAAPNGRAVLCLDGDATLSFSGGAYFDRIHEVDADAARAQVATGEPLPIALFDANSLDEAYSRFGVGRNPSEATVLVQVRSYPEGTPLTEVDIALGTDHEGRFELDGDLLIFANVTPGTPPLEVTPPTELECQAPATLGLGPAVITSTLVACQ